MDRIDLVELTAEVIVGVLDAEQRRAQPLVGQVSLWLNLEAAGDTGDLGQSVNYAAVAHQVMFLMRHGRFRLLETLSLAALRLLLAPPASGEPRAQVTRARIVLRKPEILAPLAIPGTKVTRGAAWAARAASVALPGGAIAEELVDTGREGAWRVRVPAGGTYAVAPDHAVYLIAGVARRDERVTLGAGTAVPEGRVARLFATDDGPLTLLVVRVPAPPA